MKIDLINEKTKIEKCLRHLDATIDLFRESIKYIESKDEENAFWAIISLENASAKIIIQKYRFSTSAERDLLIDEIIKTYELDKNNN
ncbi:MAG: hypothetical protein SA378_05280 [Sedimentibacter sp.]|uniref:hypothetical protein n=1 Tax=Sedimentibacter sp. TaxID=1960295 RepID=UPI002981D935|nr:hypothetical protein [Sedimentibacter sp.]MDW5299534.1 hypothetical protein [Sedimentibacter sp.]